MKRRGNNKTISRLVFFLPILVLVVAVAYAYIASSPGTGTLVVIAQSPAGYGLAARQLVAPVDVSGSNGSTPFTLSLTQGAYNVTFFKMDGYNTPQQRYSEVVSGKTVYAVGVYLPRKVGIEVTGDGFNSSSVQAVHGVSPVVWVNDSPNFAVLLVQPVGRVVINSGQNFTYVYQNAGTFEYSYLSSPQINGSVFVR